SHLGVGYSIQEHASVFGVFLFIPAISGLVISFTEWNGRNIVFHCQIVADFFEFLFANTFIS
ncbi:MAG: hypothetical protein RR776_13560, partial [Niameybacter sp.]|uniref:hypothetical protein n=1 Tax=Niameybacter sp. TaxID=2033640 RepID=UPI002FC7C1EC